MMGDRAYCKESVSAKYLCVGLKVKKVLWVTVCLSLIVPV